VDDAVVYLVPVGKGLFELYSETPDDPPPDARAPATAGFWRRLLHRMHQRWDDTVQLASRPGSADGWFARVRDRAVCKAAESIAEQRTLWSLRHFTAVSLVHPSDLSEAAAAAARDALLTHARRHHGWWLTIDTTLFIGSGVLMLIPGPNILAYYFAFRVLGHYFSWRGARQAIDATAWRLTPEPVLAELGGLAHVARSARAARVAAIAAELNLPRLAAFFDRTAVPTR
jgi:hypothetical protein